MKQNTVDPVELLGQLVSIPSYVAESANEVALADFLTGFCEQYLPELTVEKQYIGDAGRYNVVIKGRRAPRLFVLGHIDTVRPKDSWQTDPSNR
jgi:Acetylornithine deacetylase/Succinyl-diaminopimelate desuccinylase and related deacylases